MQSDDVEIKTTILEIIMGCCDEWAMIPGILTTDVEALNAMTGDLDACAQYLNSLGNGYAYKIVRGNEYPQKFTSQITVISIIEKRLLAQRQFGITEYLDKQSQSRHV